MKSKLSLVIFLCGFAALLVLAIGLTRYIYKMPVADNKPKPAPAASAPVQSFSDAVIEVGKDSGTMTTQTPSKPVKDTQITSDTGNKQGGPASSLGTSVGKVAYLSGTATATDQSGKARLLVINADIFTRDRIETSAKAKMDIKFTDGTRISQGEKSSIIIDECLYDPASAERCSFAGRITKGICRVVTGLITDINPERFKIRTRMATVGIRGCDLVFKCNTSKDDVYVLELGRAKSVQVQTTSDGTPLMDLNTGDALPVEKKKIVDISITDPLSAVTITNGKAPEERRIGIDESRELITESSHLTPAKYELLQKSDGATLKIAPAPVGTSQDDTLTDK